MWSDAVRTTSECGLRNRVSVCLDSHLYLRAAHLWLDQPWHRQGSAHRLCIITQFRLFEANTRIWTAVVSSPEMPIAASSSSWTEAGLICFCLPSVSQEVKNTPQSPALPPPPGWKHTNMLIYIWFAGPNLYRLNHVNGLLTSIWQQYSDSHCGCFLGRHVHGFGSSVSSVMQIQWRLLRARRVLRSTLNCLSIVSKTSRYMQWTLFCCKCQCELKTGSVSLEVCQYNTNTSIGNTSDTI